MKRYYINATIKLVVSTNGFDDPVKILNEMDYSFSSDRAEIESELLDFNFMDVK